MNYKCHKLNNTIVIYKNIVTCFQSVLKTYIILVDQSSKTGNSQLHQHTCGMLMEHYRI